MADRPSIRARGCRQALTALIVLSHMLGAYETLRADDADRTVVILYHAKKSYETAARAVEAGLRDLGRDSTLIRLPGSSDKEERESLRERLTKLDPAVIATGGTDATRFALEAVADVPVVFFLMPNAVDAPFLAPDSEYRSRLAGVPSDISPKRRVEWAARTLPGLSSFAVLHGGDHRATVDGLTSAAAARGVRCVPIVATHDTIPAAIDALNASGCDGLIMIPDAQVYNAATVQRVLLWGIRHKKAVWSFSENVVKAGALAGQFADYADIGRQTAGIIQRVLDGAGAGSIGVVYPDQIGRAVNRRTADMIGATPTDQALGDETVIYGDE